MGAGSDELPEDWMDKTVEDDWEPEEEIKVTEPDTVPYLVILTGDDQGKRFRLESGRNVLGRNPQANIVLHDLKMSRNHAAFLVSGSQVEIEDTGSTNGIYVDGNRVSSADVTTDTRIQIGNTLLKIIYKDLSEIEFEEALYQAATTDALTGVDNRKAFMEGAAQEVAYSKRNGFAVSVVMIDADHFKAKNDEFGHPAGDYVLKTLAKIMKKEKREEDMLGRYGGEEFIMLLRGATTESATIFCDRLRQSIESYWFEFEENEIPTTVSIGICSRAGEDIVSLEDMIRLADEALYEAKTNGRNRVAVADADN